MSASSEGRRVELTKLFSESEISARGGIHRQSLDLDDQPGVRQHGAAAQDGTITSIGVIYDRSSQAHVLARPLCHESGQTADRVGKSGWCEKRPHAAQQTTAVRSGNRWLNRL